MEFFGITYFGPQNYVRDIMRDDYKEPMSPNDVNHVLDTVKNNTTCPSELQRPDVDTYRVIDCYIGRVNGFAYGSSVRFRKMKIKGVMHPTGPIDMYRLPPTSSIDYGWWLCDPALQGATWQHTFPRYPQPRSPNTLVLDKERQNNKYATFF